MTGMIPHEDLVFEDQSVYVSGCRYDRCTFRRCTLILKDLSAIGRLADCRFEQCAWYLNTIIADRDDWDAFLNQVAPAIDLTLPPRNPPQ